jgi:hypothetical protein
MANASLSRALTERLQLLEVERLRNAELQRAYLVVEASAFSRLGAFARSLKRSRATRSLGAALLGAAVAGCGVTASAAKASPTPSLSAGAGGVRDVTAACRIHGPLGSGATVGIDAFAVSRTTRDIPDRRDAQSAGAYEMYGWGRDRNSAGAARAVCLVVDGRVEDRAMSLYGEPRADVAKALGNPDLARSGYLIKIPAGTFTPGQHRIGVAVVSSDGSIAQSSVVRTITFH